MRTDDNRNPAAFTTELARQAGLVLGVEYEPGTPFPVEQRGGRSGSVPTLSTARLIGQPIVLTIKVIDAVGYYTHTGARRWEYIAIPKFIWDELSYNGKRDVIGFHYQHEGGTEMRDLFPNYGAA